MDPSADELLERAAERANIAHTIFMLLDVDADGIVGVEQVGSRPALRRTPGSSGGADLWPVGAAVARGVPWRSGAALGPAPWAPGSASSTRGRGEPDPPNSPTT